MNDFSDKKLRNLSSEDRHVQIVELLDKQERIPIAELAERFGVTAVTVRSDLATLERRQLLRRVRGGAVALRPARFERPTGMPKLDFIKEKERIGLAASLRVRDGETIILDSGSTTLAMAYALPAKLSDVVVLTNCLDVSHVLHDHRGVDVIVTGGMLRKARGQDVWRTLVPPLATLLLREINADTAYLCCTGIDPEMGLTNGNWEEAELKKAMIASSRQVVFVADHAKVGHVGSARITSINHVAALITDSEISASDQAALEAAGLNLVLA